MMKDYEEKILKVENGKVLIEATEAQDVKDGKEVMGETTFNKTFKATPDALVEALEHRRITKKNLVEQLENLKVQKKVIGKVPKLTPELRRFRDMLNKLALIDQHKKLDKELDSKGLMLEKEQNFIDQRKKTLEEVTKLL